MATVLPFQPPALKEYNVSSFRKGLHAMSILLQYTAPEALVLIDVWVARGLLSVEEKTGLYEVLGFMGPA